MESICGLEVGALISNSHLMHETTVHDAIEGIKPSMMWAELDLQFFYAGVNPSLVPDVKESWERDTCPDMALRDICFFHGRWFYVVASD